MLVNEQDDEQVHTHDSRKTPGLDGINVTTRFVAAVAFIAASFYRYPRETFSYTISARIFIGAMSFFLLSNCLEMISASKLGKAVAGHATCAFGVSLFIAGSIIELVKLSSSEYYSTGGGPLIDVDAYLWITGSIFLVIGHLVETIAAASKQAPALGILGSLFFVIGSVLTLRHFVFLDVEDFQNHVEDLFTAQSALYLTGSSVYVLHAIVYTIAKYSRV
eukprot:scaffold1262_cov206-Chaetoceros_neogracile.AAC.5